MLRWAVAVVWLFGCGSSVAQSEADAAYAQNWGPALHSIAPPIDAPDQNGKFRTFATLTGPNGLLLVFVRSADW